VVDTGSGRGADLPPVKRACAARSRPCGAPAGAAESGVAVCGDRRPRRRPGPRFGVGGAPRLPDGRFEGCNPPRIAVYSSISPPGMFAR